MRTRNKISFRLDDERQKGLESRCEELGCCPSDYLRGLIDVDLEEAQEATEQGRQKETQASSGHRTYYLHKSNPDIKLVSTFIDNGETYYLDTEGRKWLMAPDRSLIGVAKVHA